jgi:YHS domain-containing protein
MMKPALSSPDIHIDPVCGMQANRTGSKPRLKRAVRTYYFCAEVCRAAFNRSPQQYVTAQGGKRKSQWQRYLDRLGKADDAKPPKCCG